MVEKHTLPNTDPYVATEEPHDTLGDHSRTPFMFGGASGILRFVVLLAFAAFFIYGKSREPARSNPLYGGLTFPKEIQIHGSRQSALGGGAAPFGALGVYVKMTPRQVTSPPPKEWAALDAFADHKGELGESDDFFEALADAKCEKALLVQFDGRAETSSFLSSLESLLSRDLDLSGAAAVVSALQGALKDDASAPLSVPPAGGQLYVACDRRRSVHVAYAPPAEVGVRNTAPLASSLQDGDVPGACRAVFDAMLGGGAGGRTALAREAKAGVAAGFTTLYGRGRGGEDEWSKTEL